MARNNCQCGDISYDKWICPHHPYACDGGQEYLLVLKTGTYKICKPCLRKWETITNQRSVPIVTSPSKPSKERLIKQRSKETFCTSCGDLVGWIQAKEISTILCVSCGKAIK